MTATPLLISLPKQISLKKNKGIVPLSVITLCNYLHEHGVDAELLDIGLHCEQSINSETETKAYAVIAAALRQKHPLYIGFNCFTTAQFSLLRALADRIRKEFPSMPIAIGGMHPSMFAKDILTYCPSIDFVVIGEGEEQTLALVDVCQGNSERLPRIPALGWRKPDGTVVLNPRDGYLEDFGTRTHYGWSQVSLSDYTVDTSTWNNPKQLSFELAVPIMTTRSCPFRCSFCSVPGFLGKKLRFRNPQDVLDEVEYLHKELGQNYFEFADDNINVSKSHAMQIFSGIRDRGMDIHFSLTNGIHLASADHELIDTMYAAGLAMIKFPVEHGNDYIRNTIIGKNVERSHIVSLARHIRQYNVFTFGLFIFGFPEETRETFAESIDLMHELALDMYPSVFLVPFPGTPVYEQCVRDKLLVRQMDETTLYEGAIFLDVDLKQIYIKPYGLEVDELLELKRQAEELYCYSERAKRLVKAFQV